MQLLGGGCYLIMYSTLEEERELIIYLFGGDWRHNKIVPCTQIVGQLKVEK